MEIMGDYATVIPSIKLMQSDNSHTEWIAQLAGKRMALVSELPEGQWKASLINNMVSGEPQTARLMRQDSFTFVPQFKLIILANELPRIPGSGFAGLSRRLHALPMNNCFRGSKADTQLPDKLRAEYPGILQWMMKGAKAYLDADTMPPVPESMKAETESYTTTEDTREQWADECLIFDEDEFTPTAELHANFCESMRKPKASRHYVMSWLKTHKGCTSEKRRVAGYANPVFGLHGVTIG